MEVSPTLRLRVAAVRCEARDVMLIELRDPEGAALPPFAAGAHLEVLLGNRLSRRYSLCNDPRETHRYCIGVGLSRDSRGGSRYVHERLKLGQTLMASAPRNHFPLLDVPGERIFIAGGIGITPIMSMIHASNAAGRSWRLFYCARNRVRAAFYEELQALGHDDVILFHFDDEQQGRWFDPAALLRGLPGDAQIYTCGPEPLMRAVAAAGTAAQAGCLHFEWFSAATRADAGEAGREFTVRLARSGCDVTVPAGKSILDALEDSGHGVPWSCREGLCATCRVDVLAGECDHRDNVLSQEERASNKSILVCVSRARSEVLELDL